MQSTLLRLTVCLVLAVIIAGCGPRGNLTVAEKRDAIIDMEKETLERLYKESPGTKEKIANATGYGTFANANVNHESVQSESRVRDLQCLLMAHRYSSSPRRSTVAFGGKADMRGLRSQTTYVANDPRRASTNRATRFRRACHLTG